MTNQNGGEKLHFVLETKGNLDLFGRRGYKNLKIHCGAKHFKAWENGWICAAAIWNKITDDF